MRADWKRSSDDYAILKCLEEISEQDQGHSDSLGRRGKSRSNTGDDPDSFRLLMSELAQSRDRVAVIVDAVSAFLQAESGEGAAGSGKTTKRSTWSPESFAEVMWNHAPTCMCVKHVIASWRITAMILSSWALGKMWCCSVIGYRLNAIESMDAHEGWFLKRKLWVDESGWLHEADERHVRKLLQDVGLDEANARGTPGARDVEEFEGSEEPLTPAENAAY
eukprot:3737274-Amphidinium_carterae.3